MCYLSRLVERLASFLKSDMEVGRGGGAGCKYKKNGIEIDCNSCCCLASMEVPGAAAVPTGREMGGWTNTTPTA